jgi:hypothetical protein
MNRTWHTDYVHVHVPEWDREGWTERERERERERAREAESEREPTSERARKRETGFKREDIKIRYIVMHSTCARTNAPAP